MIPKHFEAGGAREGVPGGEIGRCIEPCWLFKF